MKYLICGRNGLDTEMSALKQAGFEFGGFVKADGNGWMEIYIEGRNSVSRLQSLVSSRVTETDDRLVVWN